jgi:hypothetical protein
MAWLILSSFLGGWSGTIGDRRSPPISPSDRAGIPVPTGSDAGAWETVTKLAAGWSVELRYQQSFTSGWSGALKMPVGVDAGISGSTALVKRQMTFPELTEAFRDLLRRIAPYFVVVIGIDELDKIESASKAHEFVNEVKAIFGVPGVFYLISVSDSALSSFARRGLPVRDAFDSAFDEIVEIGFMDHKAAKDLLSRRVIGIPDPVVSFCLCMSGGLPRDLIRVCRSLFAQVEVTADRSLRTLIKTIVDDDICAKIDATITHVLDIAGGLAAAEALVPIRRLQQTVLAGSDLLPACRSLLDIAQTLSSAASENGSQSVADAAADLAVFTMYVVTVANTFYRYPSGSGWEDAQKQNIFRQVSAFRRSLARSSLAANVEITDFRTTNDMHYMRV